MIKLFFLIPIFLFSAIVSVAQDKPVAVKTKVSKEVSAAPEKKKSSGDAFCDNLLDIIHSSRNGFKSVKGDSVERMITGAKKKHFKSKIKIHPQNECYINDNAKYPECECILGSDHAITPQLKEEYKKYKTKIEKCFSDTEWSIMEKDSSNDFFLKGTEFKRLVVSGKQDSDKIKFQLYMYSSMIEKKRIIELKIEGVMLKDEHPKKEDVKPATDTEKSLTPTNPNAPPPVKTKSVVPK